MEIKTVQSGQGLLSVEVDNKPTDFKISNNNGVWKMYRVRIVTGDFYNFLKIYLVSYTTLKNYLVMFKNN